MKWTKFALETTTQAVDLVSNMLDELGIEGIEIEDKVPITEEEKKEMFIDILPDLGEDDGKAIVSFYISDGEDKDSILSSVKEGLVELADFVEVGDMEIAVSVTEDKDWINNWKQYWKPFRVADDIIIKPTWETLEEKKENDLVIEIDPGTAFGTGSHETTKLCIQGLRKYITDETVLLDVGSGSGILSIIGLKLGAKSALGTDIDPNAIHAMYENAEVNGITE
ncbi:50S ribosomal protein L11 methyltransferase, partial [Anaerosporobacter sp.]|uniref:50S ribosomal protein L11 methyltransferase n=1 Tax=Anaerosporobacter sp. TaxID=1872529 RepID=UPI002896C368